LITTNIKKEAHIEVHIEAKKEPEPLHKVPNEADQVPIPKPVEEVVIPKSTPLEVVHEDPSTENELVSPLEKKPARVRNARKLGRSLTPNPPATKPEPEPEVEVQASPQTPTEPIPGASMVSKLKTTLKKSNSLSHRTKKTRPSIQSHGIEPSEVEETPKGRRVDVLSPHTFYQQSFKAVQEQVQSTIQTDLVTACELVLFKVIKKFKLLLDIHDRFLIEALRDRMNPKEWDVRHQKILTECNVLDEFILQSMGKGLADRSSFGSQVVQDLEKLMLALMEYFNWIETTQRLLLEKYYKDAHLLSILKDIVELYRQEDPKLLPLIVEAMNEQQRTEFPYTG